VKLIGFESVVGVVVLGVVVVVAILSPSKSPGLYQIGLLWGARSHTILMPLERRRSQDETGGVPVVTRP